MAVHEHSTEALGWLKRQGVLNVQQAQILALCAKPEVIGKGLTMRQIHAELEGIELVSVRARCTELQQAGLLKEVGSAKCAFTGRTVALVHITAGGEYKLGAI